MTQSIFTIKCILNPTIIIMKYYNLCADTQRCYQLTFSF